MHAACQPSPFLTLGPPRPALPRAARLHALHPVLAPPPGKPAGVAGPGGAQPGEAADGAAAAGAAQL